MVAGRGALAGIQLNDNEKAAIKTISAKYRAELSELREANRNQAAGQNAQLRAQVEAIAERERAEIRAALTAEHQAQFDANLAKRPQPGAGQRGARPPRPPVL
jgi:CHAT domain-containing protein